ncbi:YciI family protein [Sediminimonas qiaohouensis]|uniref:YciI family protein n=1 Tax=Sediminimonas qiaohouensis TaxID=552061 RepID=UPI0003FCE7B5|nr:YciI family protein [Sediminimonas qiaohouensis]
MSQNSMPAEAIRSLVEEKGMLAKQLYLVHTTPTGDLDAVLAVVEEHLDYQVQLETEGILFAAGPNWTEDEQEWRGDGTVVIRAASMTEARAIMDADPMHAKGARRYAIRP